MMTRLLAAALLFTMAPAAQQQPVLRGGVELVLVDVQVTARDGAPVRNLKAEQFEVTIDGKKRPIVNLELVEYAQPGAAAPAAAAADPAVSAAAGAGRVLILGVDQSSLQTGNEPAAREAVTRLVALANPDDAIGLVTFPQPGVVVSPTRDRRVISEALNKIQGQFQIPKPRFNISLIEANDFLAGDTAEKNRLYAKFCQPGDPHCPLQVDATCFEIASTFEMQALRSVGGLQALMDAVRDFPGRKTVVVVSAGFASTDRPGGRPDVKFEADMIGQRAALANAVVYTLHLDLSFLNTYSAANAGRGLQTLLRNSSILANGLERFTGNAGGTLITVHASPDSALTRLLRETSSYYLLAVEPLPEHRDGKIHRIQVKVSQRGADVRARTSVVVPKAGSELSPLARLLRH
jgi:VWFA-related protein